MDPETLLVEVSARIRVELAGAIPGWVTEMVHERSAAAGIEPGEEATASAAADAAAFVDACLDDLFSTDIDRQRTNPLAVLRAATAYPTAVLEAAGVPEARRDPVAVEQFPEDVYDLVPASFADVAPDLAELGLVWGAAKARVHRDRHESGGDQ